MFSRDPRPKNIWQMVGHSVPVPKPMQSTPIAQLDWSAMRKPLTTQRSCWRSAEKQGQTGAGGEIWEPPKATADASAVNESASWKPCSLGERVLTAKFSMNSIHPSVFHHRESRVTACKEQKTPAYSGKEAATDVLRGTTWPSMDVFGQWNEKNNTGGKRICKNETKKLQVGIRNQYQW